MKKYIVISIIIILGLSFILLGHKTPHTTATTKTPPVTKTTPPATTVAPEANLPQNVAPVTTPPPVSPTQTVNDLVNAERTKVGDQPLTEVANLDASAAAKCSDMLTNHYFAHDYNGLSWIRFLPTPYFKAGENLALNYYTSATVVAAWMASPEHKANILDPVFNKVGYATCHDIGHTYYVQQFEDI